MFYSELAPTNPWCNVLQTSFARRKYVEEISDEQPKSLISSINFLSQNVLQLIILESWWLTEIHVLPFLIVYFGSSQNGLYKNMPLRYSNFVSWNLLEKATEIANWRREVVSQHRIESDESHNMKVMDTRLPKKIIKGIALIVLHFRKME